jgi:hypothetical protein
VYHSPVTGDKEAEIIRRANERSVIRPKDGDKWDAVDACRKIADRVQRINYVPYADAVTVTRRTPYGLFGRKYRWDTEVQRAGWRLMLRTGDQNENQELWLLLDGTFAVRHGNRVPIHEVDELDESWLRVLRDDCKERLLGIATSVGADVGQWSGKSIRRSGRVRQPGDLTQQVPVCECGNRTDRVCMDCREPMCDNCEYATYEGSRDDRYFGGNRNGSGTHNRCPGPLGILPYI